MQTSQPPPAAVAPVPTSSQPTLSNNPYLPSQSFSAPSAPVPSQAPNNNTSTPASSLPPSQPLPTMQMMPAAPQVLSQGAATNFAPASQPLAAGSSGVAAGVLPGQQFPMQGLNGGWQSDKDYQERRKMIAKIVHLLQQRKPNAPQEWLKKLPQMAKRLEESLYRSAKSFDEYNDAATLKHRLQQLAVNIGMKTKKMQQNHLLMQHQQKLQIPGAAAPQPHPVAAPLPQASTTMQLPNASTNVSAQLQLQANYLQSTGQAPIPSAVPAPSVPRPVPAAPAVVAPVSSQPAPAQPPQPTTPRVVNMADINPMIASTHPPPVAAVPPSMQTATYSAPASSSQPAQTVSSAPAPVMPYLATTSQPQPSPAPISATPAAAPVAAPAPVNGVTSAVAAAPGAAANGNRQISDRQQVLRHQQQRLLLLRHAAKCQHEDGRCPVTPHCAGMKRLWKHIAECKNQKCLVPHCVSSRYVLSHYHRCKDVRCPVCGPVREAIHRSHEKQKHMQALKQRHQQAVQQNQLTTPAPAAPASSVAVAAPVPVPGPLTQPNPPALVGPVSPTAVSSAEPANKRQRTGSGILSVPGFQPQQQQQRPLAQPLAPVSALVPPQGAPVAPAVTSPGAGARPVVASAPGIAFANGQVMTPKHSGPKPQEDHTLINCFSVEQIETHIASLNKGLQLAPLKLKTKCLEVLKVLQSHQHAWVFNAPVDPVELGLPDYFEVIKKPMDLGTIRKQLENGVYHTLREFEGNVHLTFDNAMLYNPEGSVVYNMAKEMKAKFQIDYEKMVEQLNAEEDVKRRNGEACLLCGCEKLLFEPPVFYCNGLNCASKRIRRNSYYYVGGNNQYHWCHQCFQELRDNQSIDLGDMQIKKEALVKKKNDEVHEESWVQCDRCERWVHQICALFNTRQNKDQRSEYACPRCTIEERRKLGNLQATSSAPMAEDLPRTVLSEYLENHVRRKVDEFVEMKSKQKAKDENMPLEQARKKLQMGGAITIRQVTSMDRKLEVRDRMKARYAFKNYPEEFTFRCKCIVVFQNLDGVDVMLFGLYVYEHDETNPKPNQRTIYVSYLDSVYYMRPRQMRTLIYHEILISYLDYVRKRGFATAHIWACPPLKGDDYILYAKPEDQKTPKDDRLRQWYIDMLTECQKRGIVGKVTNMYDLYFSDPKNDATIVPYMEGDYFPAEVENIIKDIEEGKTGKKGATQGKKKDQKAKQKKKSGRGGTRSTGIDEDSLKASGIVPTGADQKGLEEGGTDYVMTKLGETIHPMKESFIVAYLAWAGATEDTMVVPKEIQDYRDANGITWKIEGAEKTDATAEPVAEQDNDNVGRPVESSAQGDVEQNNERQLVDGGHFEPAVGQESPEQHNTSSGETRVNTDQQTDSSKVPVNLSIREGKFAAMAARKRDREGLPKEADATGKKDDVPVKEKKTVSKGYTITDDKGNVIKIIDDDDEELDCEFLNNRQAFLNLCQGNHYQFDQLRRAKHSSMMVLWHLHNRDAPKFVQQCATCSREMLAGFRFHCPTCADFDQCQECVSNPKIPRHPHPLKPIPVTNGQKGAELTEAQRKERQRSIQLHMQLLLHAATCNSAKCPSANCTKMKGLLKHGAQCQIKVAGGCSVCKRIWALLQIHARQCKLKTCAVPNCMAIRERVRQLKKQQMAMDERRRQEMNRAYRKR